MKFQATPDARAHSEARGACLKAIANWTYMRARFRDPKPHEAALDLVGPNSKVVCDEGLLFIQTGGTITAHTMKELGLC